MTVDRDDAPPGEAMAHVMRVLPARETGIAFAGLRTLPAAARWRLIAWPADGLEPTREMVEAAWQHTGDPCWQEDVAEAITAALAAAREANDGS